jgi:hypothetical protein
LSNDLGADWIWAASDGQTSQQKAEAINGQGDTFQQTAFDAHSTGSETYHYNGTIGSYGGTAGALAGFEPGNYLGTATVACVGIEIDYGPCASGERETVKFSWSKGLAADSAVFKPSLTGAELPTKRENAGVPEIGTNANADSRVSSASYALACEEGRTLNATGTRFAGSTYHGMETVNETHVGQPAITLPAGWDVTTKAEGSGEGSKSNTGYNTHQTTASHGVLRA